MDIIDCHCHLCDVETFRHTAAAISRVDFSPGGYLEEYEEIGKLYGWRLGRALSIGLEETAPGAFPDPDAGNPMRSALMPRGGRTPFREVLGINPHRLDIPGERSALEEAASDPAVVGLKIYAGYYHFHVHDPIYDPVYDLAATRGLPVMIHMGDTYSEKGLLKYAHPLEADELAVRRREINFVICHLAEPWAMTTAELLLKNPNVYADLSGMFVGDASYVEKKTADEPTMMRLRSALSFMEDFGKILFGTDWPLTPLRPYVEFIRTLVPEEHWRAVFRENALRVFPGLD